MSLDIESYKRLVHHTIWYVKDGKHRSGRLMSIGFDDARKELMAEIYSDSLRHFLNPVIRVPLDWVILQKINCSSSSNNWEARQSTDSYSPVAHRTRSRISTANMPAEHTYGQVARQQYSYHSEYFLYNHVRYDKCQVPWLKLGDEVVWLLPQKSTRINSDFPFIGRITFLGRHETVVGNEERVAVVQFDQKTDHLPGFISQNRTTNSTISTNVVNIEELMDLQNWLSTSSKTGRSRDNDNSFHSPEVVEAGGRNGENYLSSAQPEKPSAGCVADLRKKFSEQLPSTSNTIPKPLQKTKVPLADLIDLDDSVKKLSSSGLLKPSISNANEGDWRAPICLDHFVNTISTKPASTALFGIQGYNDSCYMDSVLFALFSFCHNLDDFISFKKSEIKQLPDTMKTELRENIVLPLRTQYYVPFQNTQTLRQILGSENTNFLKSYMDAEDFILTLFELLDAPPMFQYDNGVEDYVHQIFLPSSLNPSGKLNALTVQTLLNGSFMASDVKLLQPPPGLFIVKMPVSDGVLIPCERVLPDLQLDLIGILSDNSRSKRKGKTMLNLSAVICLKQNHYVTFVRTGRDVESPWVFMDSRPTDRKPYVRVLKYTSMLLKKLTDTLYHQDTKMVLPQGIYEDELKFANRITTDAYICIYENVSAK